MLFWEKGVNFSLIEEVVWLNDIGLVVDKVVVIGIIDDVINFGYSCVCGCDGRFCVEFVWIQEVDCVVFGVIVLFGWEWINQEISDVIGLVYNEEDLMDWLDQVDFGWF